MNPTACSPLVLFGAFDRHNFGDLLLPHLIAAMLPGHSFEMSGLAERDLRAFGGYRVKSLVARGRAPASHLIHVGGELLTCSAWQAAVMLLDPGEARAVIARYDNEPIAAADWAARQLGTPRAMPYVVGRGASASCGRLVFNAVGGVEWACLSASQRNEVMAALRQADWVSVRDHVTQAALRAEGMDVPLCPDPAVMVAQCFGELIRKRRQSDAIKEMRDAFPQGFLACQFSAEFGDDATLDALAQELSRVVAGTGLGLVLFCAGAAPWHDDPALYEKMLHLLPPGTARLFRSLYLWDICALIGASRGVVGSSLHGRIVALAHGLPRVSLLPPQQGHHPDKRTAFAETWEPRVVPRSVAVGQIEAALMQALAVPAAVLQGNAAHLCEQYRQSQARWIGRLIP
jgi:Polysaccharide pyruvyl transferase